MLHAKIQTDTAPPRLDLAVVEGYAPELDPLAEAAAPSHRFLRAAWYEAAGGDATTLVARRADGTLLAAIPTVAVGPQLFGARTVPGSYWPFRSVPIDPEANQPELIGMLAHPAFRAAFAPMFRIGPVYLGDPAIAPLKRAAARAGWTVLRRGLGKTFLFDLGAMRDDGAWPRKTTRRRLAGYEKQLALAGAVRFRFVSGADWDDAVFADLAAIEANSWVGKSTDGSGAKFLSARQRQQWRVAVRDPAIAAMLSATILYVGDVPAAFSFDLQAGDMQYSIASSYDDRFAACRPGKIVTYRQFEDAFARGVRTIDLGAGDSGYKREIGAVAGPEIMDFLFVRSRSAAALLRLKWEAGVARAGNEPDQVARGSRALPHPLAPMRAIDHLLFAGVVAAAALALAE
jgi:hypothetical protein